jgi:hypothetical protein
MSIVLQDSVHLETPSGDAVRPAAPLDPPRPARIAAPVVELAASDPGSTAGLRSLAH